VDVLPAMPSATHVLVAEVLQKLKLTVGSLGQDRCTERLHDLLDGHGLPSQLILGGAE